MTGRINEAAPQPASEGGLRVAVANLRYGGLGADGNDAGWRSSVQALSAAEPDIVCVQEMRGHRPDQTWAHLRRTATALGGMEAVLGPPIPHSASGNHTALLINTNAGLRIVDQGPPPEPVGSRTPWCYAELEITNEQIRAGLRLAPGRHLVVYSIHLSARSAVRQLAEAQQMASVIAEHAQLAVVAGDTNAYGRGGPIPTVRELEALLPHVRLARCVLDKGRLVPNFDVDDALTAAGLVDVAAALPPHLRQPPDLTETGEGYGRIDRLYAHPALPRARYQQVRSGGSDHDIGLYDLGAA